MIGSDRNMKTHAASGNGASEPQSRTAVYKAIHWLENYVSENPYSAAAIEARNIIRELKAVRMRRGVDELLPLIAQIAKSDRGMQEINRAKISLTWLTQFDKTTGEEI